MPPNPKRKSHRRFEAINHLTDKVIRHLEPSEGLVLLIGWRHADRECKFRASTSQIAFWAGMSKRQIIRIIDSLIAKGAIVVAKREQGTIPTTYQITGLPNGDTHVTSKAKPPPGLLMTPVTASGDTGDR